MSRRLFPRLLAVGIAAFGGLFVPAPASAQTLTEMSLEDLMNVEITSASRKEQRVADVAAAVFVISQADIRRSGMTTIPDVLRLAPGVEVAQVNATKWAVSVRGSNAIFANKLLVLIDGRSLYNRIFSGVLWDTEDLMLDDVDRIEIIRGPGAVMWGANAVNGVINIVTKAAGDTQGGLVRIDGGRSGDQAAFRYGGRRGDTSYRLYSQWTGRDQSLIAPGVRADDAAHSLTTGFRVDRAAQRNTLMVEGDYTANRARALWANLDPSTAAHEPLANDPSDTQGAHVLGRWTHARDGGAVLQVQSFVDVLERLQPIGDYRRRTVNLDTQYHTRLGARQDVVAGAGYSAFYERFDPRVAVSLTPPRSQSSIATAFLQDEIALVGGRVALTVGSQAQYDSLSGGGVQPTARLLWKASPRQRVWAAASRALRTPSLSEFGVNITFPPVPTESGLPLVVTSYGNPAFQRETLIAAEAGYRFDFGGIASIDVTGFRGWYRDLVTREVQAPIVQFAPLPEILVATYAANKLEASTAGLEIAARWLPVPALRFDASYTAFHVVPHLAASSQDPFAGTDDMSTPHTQWQARSTFSPSAQATVSAAIFRVGRLESLGVEPYTRVDANAEWSFGRGLSVQAVGQNLFDAAHAEFGGTMTNALLMSTQVARSASLRLRWAFR